MNAHRASTKRTTRTYQLAAGAALSATVAAVALPLAREFGPPPAPARAAIVDAAPPPSTPAPAMPVDEAGSVLTSVLRWQPEQAVEPETPPTEEGKTPDAPPPPPQLSTEWAYLGSILSGTSRHALVRVKDQQHMLREGAALEQTKVVKIEPAQITLEDNAGLRRDIRLLERASMFPTDPPKRPVARMNLPGNPGMPGVPGAMTQAGMNPAQIPGRPSPQTFDQARIAAEEAAKRARGGRVEEQLRNLGPEAGEKILKLMGEGNLGVADRARMLGHYGINPGASPDEAFERLRQSGVNPDDHPELIEAIKYNATEGK